VPAVAGIFVTISSAQVPFRPPAVPLVACDPYFSIWSAADKLTDVPTTHWTGRPHRLTSLIRVDGKAYRLMGDQPASVEPLPQVGFATVLPARTIFHFAGQGIGVTLTSMTPALPSNLDVLSRPVTYLTWDVRATDGREHEVNIQFSASGEPAVDDPEQQVVWSEPSVPGLMVSCVGTVSQRILGKTGDDRRIDWGYFYVAASQSDGRSPAVGWDPAPGAFVDLRGLNPHPSAPSTVAAYSFDLGKVGGSSVTRWLMLAYDDEYSIQYFRQNLRPYWRRHGMTAEQLLETSAKEYPDLKVRCERFDTELMADLRKAGGEKYALLAALAYRQCLAGCKIAADTNGQPLLFPKENTSNGCIGTVDVIFPMAPQFLLFGPSLTKAMLVSNLDYASSPRWKWPFAPHDLGTYPKANGQVYGGGERTEDDQMPVEETGNMLILLAALTKMEGNGSFAAKYWPTLEKWAAFLEQKGFDPERQLSTDDFMGHLAHNTNLSVKAAIGLASFGYLCEMTGHQNEGGRYRIVAKEYADRWAKEAQDGDHFRLAFDKPGSWSQKYNMVWDSILGLGLFSDAVKREEMAFYIKRRNPFGIALDSRQNGVPAKVDWSVWTATLTEHRSDFEALIDPVYRYVTESPQRVAMGDLYNTDNGHHIGMNARPVVGGLFLPLLYDKSVWHKWASRDATKAKNWAPLPTPPVFTDLVPTSEKHAAVWRYTIASPPSNWFEAGFDDSAWKEGPGGFGTVGTPNAVVGTVWNTDDIWIRRTVTLDHVPAGRLYVRLYHDEDADVYLNGKLVVQEPGYQNSYVELPIPSDALRSGVNTIAVHCHQTTGGQGIDVGIVVGR
jgi:hypothetical protein